jgi:hypothetical protein
MRYNLIILLTLLAFTTSYGNVFNTPEERRAAVKAMYDGVKEPEVLKKRRLGNSDAKENLGDIMDAWQYAFEINKNAHYLRSMGVTEEDGLPERKEGSTLTHNTVAEATKIAMYLKDLYEEEQKTKTAKPELSQEDIRSRRLAAEKQFKEELNKNRATPKYLGQNKDGSHEINLGGAYVHSSNNKRKLTDAALSALGGNCVEKPYGSRYADNTGADSVETIDGTSVKCTCAADKIKDPGQMFSTTMVVTVTAVERWCKCDESGGGSDYYAYVAPQCDSYPALSSNSKCTANTAAFPKTIDCAYQLVLEHGFYITLGSQFSIGYGSTGKTDDMVAEFRFGVKASGIPFSCFESPNKLGFPNIANGDRVCIALKFIADKIIAMDGNDVAEMMGGPTMKGSMKYFPFTVAYPKTYAGATGDTDKMQLLARIPLKLPTDAAKTASASTKGIDFSKPVCISTLGSKLSQGGGVKKSLQFAGALLAVVGTDFCFEMPGFSNTGKDLVFGLKVTGTAFDKSKVSLLEFINILPEAWNTMAKDLAGKGIKDLMNDAFTLKPLSACSVCTTQIPIINVAMKDLSMDAFFAKMVTQTFPDKKIELTIDIGEIVGKVAPAIMTADNKKLFKLPNMFAASRRRRLAIDDALSSQDSFEIEIPAQKLDESHLSGRHLKADKAYSFPTNAYIKEGSKCQFTYTGMPKKITCNLKLQAGPKVTLESTAEVAVAYAVNGEDLEIVSKMGFGINLGTADDYAAVKAVADKLKAIDVGGLIDDSLSKTIELAPFSVNFPKGYVKDPTTLFEVARVPVTLIKTKGMCISNMEELAPAEMKASAAALAGTMGKVTGPVGGDVCGQVDKLDLSAGFKTNVDIELKLFKKELVDVYPIIQELAKVEPAVKTMLNLIDAVMGDTIKKALNDGVKAVLPDEQNFKINMGILIAQALKKAKAGVKAMAGDALPPGALRRLAEDFDEKIVTKNGRRLSRRRLSADLVSADGSFNLGGIPKSSKPGSKDKGDPKVTVKAEESTASTSTGKKDEKKKEESEKTSGAAQASFFAALPFLFALF